MVSGTDVRPTDPSQSTRLSFTLCMCVFYIIVDGELPAYG